VVDTKLVKSAGEHWVFASSPDFGRRLLPLGMASHAPMFSVRIRTSAA